MANLLNYLMNNDVATEKETITGEFEVKRLSKSMGEPFILTLRPLRAEESDRIPFKKGGMVDTNKMKKILLSCGVTNKELNDVDLLKQYGVANKVELLDKILLPGEVTKIMEEIQVLSGFLAKKDEEDEEELIEELKN